MAMGLRAMAATTEYFMSRAGRRPALGSLLLLTLSPALGNAQEAPLSGAAGEAVIVYLIRHAEKADDGTSDPPLAIAGQIRVQVLLRLLGDVEFTGVHTTDYRRTRETARPFAQRAGVEARIYDPRDLEAFANFIRTQPGRHLVAGHSNTTPRLVANLGGKPFGDIDELEYDRLYIVSILPGRPALTTLLRFGEPYVEGTDLGLRTGSVRISPLLHGMQVGPGPPR